MGKTFIQVEIINEKYLFFCDVETTGFDPIRNDIVSICMAVTDWEHNLIDVFYDTAKPEFNKFYSEDAEKIHGFGRDELSNFQHPRDTLIKLLNFLNKYRTPGKYHVFIYHALRLFDYKFLEWAFRKQYMHWSFFKMFHSEYSESTIDMAKSMGYQGNKLNQWAERIDFELEHHNAKSDTLCCVQVHKYLRNQL